MEIKGNKYGTHRVIQPKGVLTQAALKIDNGFDTVYSNEIVCDVTSLNIDSASFTQIENECGGDADKIARRIEQIVAERGKMQNPVTGSGGMFIGRVAHIGKDLTDTELKIGDKIASLVSLSLTPLKIEKILAVHPEIDRVDVVAKAALFESGIYAKLPDDMPENLALAALDVAGAPAQKYLDLPHEDTPFSGLYAYPNFRRDAGYDRGEYTFQSVGSVAVCAAVEPCGELLDACAAPGGKSVLLAGKCGRVTAFELHEHRAKLIGSYASRMGAENISVVCRDSSVHDPAYDGRFDAVLADAPCSGYGVVGENPDIKLLRREADLSSLCKTQRAILSACAPYVRAGGCLYYSTCSVFGEENDGTVSAFWGSTPILPPRRSQARSGMNAPASVCNFCRTCRWARAFTSAR